MSGSGRAHELASAVAELAQDMRRTVAVAESLTSGALAAELGAAPNASEWFRGAVVAYAEDVKFGLLGVPRGPVVSEEAVVAMAHGAAQRLGADVVVALSGAGGPEPMDGEEPGTVWFGVITPGAEHAEQCCFPGGPSDVVAAAVDHGLVLVHRALLAAGAASQPVTRREA
jgi:nicotinamide-nucleotide amidase